MTTIRLDDMVRIKTGPFAAFTGRIEGINQARRLLKVKVNIFGRTQPTQVEFSQVEKIEIAKKQGGDEH